MNRFQAAAIHLGLSLLVFVVLAYLVVYQWYPDFFFDTDGGWRGLRIIIFVDLVLGPALTFVVYKAGKPGLKTDLSLIGTLQIICLIAGTYVVYVERPLAVVYNDGRFSVMNSGDYAEAGIEVPDFDIYPGDGPKWILVDVPTEMNAEADFRSEYFNAGRVISTATQLYQPFKFEHPSLTGSHMDVDLIMSKASGKIAVQNWLLEHGGTRADYLFYNFGSRFAYGYLVFDAATGEQLGFIQPPRLN